MQLWGSRKFGSRDPDVGRPGQARPLAGPVPAQQDPHKCMINDGSWPPDLPRCSRSPKVHDQRGTWGGTALTRGNASQVGAVGSLRDHVRHQPPGPGACSRAARPRLAEHRRPASSRSPTCAASIVLLDFWTFCCVNCLHVLDELRPLEEKYADVLVTVGVHSPKFEHEADPARRGRGRRALRGAPPGARRPRPHDLEAVRRAGLADARRGRPRGLRRRAAVRRGPRPRPRRAARRAGRASTTPRARCTAATGRTSRRRRRRPSCASPARSLALPGGTLLVSDSGHHRLVELAADGETVLRRIGSGERGLVDGAARRRRVQRAAGRAAAAGRGARRRRVRRGGRRHRQPRAARRASRGRRRDDASPAPAGSGCRARGTDRPVLAVGPRLVRRPGRGRDGRHPPALVLRPGAPARSRCWPARPTRACSTARPPTPGSPRPPAWRADGARPALAGRRRDLVAAARRTEDGRSVRRSAPGLFDFGHVDGPAAQALLQHPLGVTALPDGSVAVSDTYNGALRRYDPATDQVTHAAHRPGRAERRGAARRATCWWSSRRPTG